MTLYTVHVQYSNRLSRLKTLLNFKAGKEAILVAVNKIRIFIPKISKLINKVVISFYTSTIIPLFEAPMTTEPILIMYLSLRS